MKLVTVIALSFLVMSPVYATEPTDAEFERAIQSAFSRIKSDPELKALVSSMPADIRRVFISEIALKELLEEMENKRRGLEHGKSQGEYSL